MKVSKKMMARWFPGTFPPPVSHMTAPNHQPARLPYSVGSKF